MIRLFVAVELPDEVRSVLAGLPLGDEWRRVRPEGLHVTLAFLGWREEGDVAAIDAAVRSAVRPLGPLTTGEAILLPPRRPRVLAVELSDPSEGSVALQAAVSSALAAAGLYEPERRRWLPHVTVARARGPIRRGAPVPAVPTLTFAAPSVTLYQSRLERGGARYTPVERYPLQRLPA